MGRSLEAWDGQVVGSVVARLGDSEAVVRCAGLQSLTKVLGGGLGRLGWQVADRGDATAVPAILELLEHQDGRIRLTAVEALGWLGRAWHS